MAEEFGRPQKLFIYVKIIYNKTDQNLDLSLWNVCDFFFRV